MGKKICTEKPSIRLLFLLSVQVVTILLAERGIADKKNCLPPSLLWTTATLSNNVFFLGKPPLKRIPEVFDCWFESGSMPYAQSHYPFENKKEFEDAFPADFIAEGTDQTRGWFYTLLVLSTALFNKAPFKVTLF